MEPVNQAAPVGHDGLERIGPPSGDLGPSAESDLVAIGVAERDLADAVGVGLWKVADVLAAVGILALPVSIGFGILKFRLYEIGRIVSRALAYAIVTGLLIGVYAGLVLLITQVFRFHSTVAQPPPRWPRRRCSTCCGAGCSGRWTAGSTERDMTPTRPWRRSRPG
jgi:hypothetical protein